MPMCASRILLPVKSFHQRIHECAIGALTSLANYYDKKITYEDVRKYIPEHAKKDKEGLYVHEEIGILNKLGFSKVTLVSGDLEYFDVSWNKLTKRGKISRLNRMIGYWKHRPQERDVGYIKSCRDWLKNKDYESDIIVDTEYPKYIRRHLRNDRPVLAAFKWHAMFKRKKSSNKEIKKKGQDADICGDADHHSVVIRGFDDKGVFIVDSHRQFYRNDLAKYGKGYYKLSWERFLCNLAGDCELILVY